MGFISCRGNCRRRYTHSACPVDADTQWDWGGSARHTLGAGRPLLVHSPPRAGSSDWHDAAESK
jgi:hypothetical protein